MIGMTSWRDRSCWCRGCLQPSPGTGLAPKQGCLLAPKGKAGPLASLTWLFLFCSLSMSHASSSLTWYVCVFVSLSFLAWVACVVSLSLLVLSGGLCVCSYLCVHLRLLSWLLCPLPHSTTVGRTPLCTSHCARGRDTVLRKGAPSREKVPSPRVAPAGTGLCSVLWGEGLGHRIAGIGGFSLSSVVVELKLEGGTRR